MFIHSLRRMRRGRTPKPQDVSPQSLPVHPHLLERRTLLSVSLDATTGVLAVTGTDAADQVAVRVSPSNPGDVHVQDGATIYIHRLAQVNSIQVSGGAGDDTLTLDLRGGLFARAGVEMPVRYDGGAGTDNVVLTGGPASGGVTQTLTLGPAADAGTHVSKAGALSQTVGFAGVESLIDLSVANSLTVTLNEAANLVELSNGPLVNGLATASLKAYDVTPCDHETTVPTPQPAAQTTGQLATVSVPGSAASVTAVDPQTVPDPKARKKLLRAYQQEARKAKAQELKQLRQQQREQRLLAKRQRKTAAARAATAADVQAPAPAAAAATPGRELVLGKAYLAVQFASKGRVTIDTGAGDDWVAVDHASAAAGLTALSVEGGAGADAVAEQAKPAGVTWAAAGAENVSPARNFILVNECTEPPAPQPEPPTGPTTPNTPTNPTASNGSADRDDDGDDGDDASTSGSRDSDTGSSGSLDSDASGSSDSSSSSGASASSSSNGD